VLTILGMEGLAGILTAETWSRLIAAGIARVFEPGWVLMDQGAPADHVVVVLDGRVKLTKVDAQGNTLVLAIRGPGELVGELGLLQPDRRRTATVTAVDRCSTRVVPLDEFTTLARDLGLERRILEHVARRLQNGEDVRADLSVRSAGGRVLSTLLRLAVPNRRVPVGGPGRDRPTGSGSSSSSSNGVGIDIRISQAELATAAGVNRATVAAELRKLRDDGVVLTSRGRIDVVDVAELRRRADE